MKTLTNKPVCSILLGKVLRFTVIKIINNMIIDNSCIPSDAIWQIDDVCHNTNRTRIIRISGGLDTILRLFRDMTWKDSKHKICIFNEDGIFHMENTYARSSNEEMERVLEENLPGEYPLSMKPPQKYSDWWCVFLGTTLTFHTKVRGAFAQGLEENGFGDEIARWILAGEEKPLYDSLYSNNIICPIEEMSYHPIEALISLASYISIPMQFITIKNDKIKRWKPHIYNRIGHEMELPHLPTTKNKDAFTLVKSNDPPLTFELNGVTYSIVAGLSTNIGLVKASKGWISFDNNSTFGIGAVLHLSRAMSWYEDLKWMVPNLTETMIDEMYWLYIKCH